MFQGAKVFGRRRDIFKTIMRVMKTIAVQKHLADHHIPNEASNLGVSLWAFFYGKVLR